MEFQLKKDHLTGLYYQIPIEAEKQADVEIKEEKIEVIEEEKETVQNKATIVDLKLKRKYVLKPKSNKRPGRPRNQA